MRLCSADGEELNRAFREVLAAERSVVFGLLVRLSDDRDTAADLLQNVWLKLARSRRSLREGTVLRAWLCKVAKHEYFSYRRTRTLEERRTFALRGQQPTQAIATAPQRVEARAAIRRLSKADRDVLLATTLDGLSPREVAENLGIAEATLRQRLSRARRRLRSPTVSPTQQAVPRGRPDAR